MTQRRKPATFWKPPQGDRDGGWHDGGRDLQQHLITDWKNYAAINEIYAEFFPVTNRRDSAFSADW